MKTVTVNVDQYTELYFETLNASGCAFNKMSSKDDPENVFWFFNNDDEVVTVSERRTIRDNEKAWVVTYHVGEAVKYDMIKDTFNSVGEEL